MENRPMLSRKLNLLFITQDDPFYVKTFFDEFLKSYGEMDEVAGVVICNTFGAKSRRKLFRRIYGFYGPVGFARMALRLVKVRVLGQVSRLLALNRFYTLRQLFNHYSIKVEKAGDVNSPLFLRRWKDREIDVIVSVACPKILKSDLLRLPSWGCLNIHSAKLPQYRGMMPVFWQMYHGEKNVGITVHQMNETIDDGGIIIQKEVPRDPQESLDQLIKRTKRIGAHLMIEAINRVRDDDVVCRANRKEESSYYSFPTRKHVIHFLNRGNRIL